MQYWIFLRNNGEPILFQGSLLDIYPRRTFDLMEVSQVPEKLGMCDDCNLNCHCHVMEEIDNERTSRLLCPILFHDVVKPPWKLSEIN